MSVESALYSIIKADAPTVTYATGGIYADVAEQGNTPPLVVFKIKDTTPEPTKDGASDFDTYELEIAAIALDSDDADALAALLKTALDDYTGTISSTTVDRITFKDKRGYYDNASELHIREQDFNIIIKS